MKANPSSLCCDAHNKKVLTRSNSKSEMGWYPHFHHFYHIFGAAASMFFCSFNPIPLQPIWGENLQGRGKRPSTARHLGQEHSSIQHRHIRLLATCGAGCAHPNGLKPTGNGWKRDMRHTSTWRFSWEKWVFQTHWSRKVRSFSSFSQDHGPNEWSSQNFEANSIQGIAGKHIP